MIKPIGYTNDKRPYQKALETGWTYDHRLEGLHSTPHSPLDGSNRQTISLEP